MFTKKQYIEILAWMLDYVQRNKGVYLPMQIPVTGVIDYTWGDLVRTMKGFRGDGDVVRAYERLRELLTLRVIECESLELPLKTKLTEELLADWKVGGLTEEVREEKLTDAELEKRMEEMGWYRRN